MGFAQLTLRRPFKSLRMHLVLCLCMTALPFNLKVPIAGLLLAIVSWLLLDTFGSRFRSGLLRR